MIHPRSLTNSQIYIHTCDNHKTESKRKNLETMERKATVAHSRAAVGELVIVSKMLRPKGRQ